MRDPAAATAADKALDSVKVTVESTIAGDVAAGGEDQDGEKGRARHAISGSAVSPSGRALADDDGGPRPSGRRPLLQGREPDFASVNPATAAVTGRLRRR